MYVGGIIPIPHDSSSLVPCLGIDFVVFPLCLVYGFFLHYLVSIVVHERFGWVFMVLDPISLGAGALFLVGLWGALVFGFLGVFLGYMDSSYRVKLDL